VADGQVWGQIIAAGLTALASGGAAFVGVRTANRNTDVEDRRARETALAEEKRAKEAAEWDRLQRMVTMACSANPVEAYVGVSHLQQSKDTWKGNADQKTFIRRTLSALTAPAIQAYRGGQTTVVTTPPPSTPGGP
jgi:hypothetical protein